MRVSGGEVAIKDAILVAVETGRGIGLGESSPMAAGLVDSCDTPEGCWDDLAQRIAPDLIGWAFGAVEEIAERAATWPGCSRFAVAGAETACWDLLGQARHATIAELLGASIDQLDRGVESGLAVGLYPTIVELLRTIEAHLDEGYRRVKIRIRPGQDVELVRAVRQHFGEDLPLMVDANGAYTSADLDVFRELDGFDLLMFEQPMAADDLDGLVALQKAVATPVCLDETAGTARQDRRGDPPRRLPDRQPQDPAARRVRPRAGAARPLPPARGGLLGGLHARARHRPGTRDPPGGPGQLQVSQPTSSPAPMVRRRLRRPPDRARDPRPAEVPTRPGLGYQIDPAKVRRYQVRHLEFTAPRG